MPCHVVLLLSFLFSILYSIFDLFSKEEKYISSSSENGALSDTLTSSAKKIKYESGRNCTITASQNHPAIPFISSIILNLDGLVGKRSLNNKMDPKLEHHQHQVRSVYRLCPQ